MFVYDPSDISGNGGYKLNWSYAPVAWTNGPVGQTNYTDDIWGFGINIGTGGSSRIDTSKPSLGISFESKYYNNSVFGMEFHLQGYDSGGVNHRPITGFFSHDNSATVSGLGFYCNYLDISNWNDGATMVHLVHPGSALFGTQFLTLTMPGGVNGNTVMALRGPTAGITGSVNGVDTVLKASDNVVSKIINTSSTSNSGALATIETAGGGDASMQFAVSSGATNWIMGCDNSDSDKFKISNYWALGTNDRVMIDANTVAFGLPAKLPSYTVVGVPSASTVGAGAMLYVSDETGGAVPAFSDGTNWRRVTDRAVIS